jgi:hypothetical protein
MKELHGRVLRWGNSLGLRISKADAERLGLHEGDEVDLLVPQEGKDVPELPAFDLGPGLLADHHDRGWDEPEDP